MENDIEIKEEKSRFSLDKKKICKIQKQTIASENDVMVCF